ncbi:MAG TPA: hypothetical protein VMQ65_09920 [Candidatus Limnocylindria bacterium]|nr:hypothetical protein [Candidatus Limnocylindria bacterium]
MRRGFALAALALVVLVAACGGSVNPSLPNGAGCATDIRAPGAFPNLEALLPLGMIEASPTTVDSGANCSRASLGTYTGHGIGELRFAGATWDHGDGEGTVVAVFTTPQAGQPALEATWVEEFYTAGAVAGRTIDDVKTSRPVMRGAGQVFRLEAINNLSLQTVVIWPAGPYVRVVIVATNVEPNASRADHDQRVETAVEVAAAVPVQ